MVETELKFQVPVESRTAVTKALGTKTARTVQLRARYVDTPDRRLARAGLALRLRQEGRQWVQALKGPGSGPLHRIEHEVPVDRAEGEPRIDVRRHAGTPAAQALAVALGENAAPLDVVFETRVLRTFRTVRSGGAAVELSLDVGEVIAGSRRLPLFEIEFELKAGSVGALLALAARWVQRHRLWLDVRSKAERGVRLAAGLEAGAAVQAGDISIDASQGADAALRAIVGACLGQVLPNAADLAGDIGGPEHLHQLRVGLRRLRCALRTFGDMAVDTDPSWLPALAGLFARLGTARDRDVIAQTVLPRLRQAGAPLAELPHDVGAVDTGEVLRGGAWNRLLLELIGFSQAARAPGAGAARAPLLVDIAAILRGRLRRMRRQLKEDAAAFRTFDDAQRHRVRKRLKRFRYSVEFFASMFSRRSMKRWAERAAPAQDVLGRLNDLAVAEAAFRAILPSDARAQFAVDWLSSRREELIPEASSALAKLAKTSIVLRDSTSSLKRRRERQTLD
jgi:inorganic triphosphatase YgiF